MGKEGMGIAGGKRKEGGREGRGPQGLLDIPMFQILKKIPCYSAL